MHTLEHIRAGLFRRSGTVAAILIAASACATEPDATRQPTASAPGLLETVVTGNDRLPNDAITIDSARVVGETLVAFVSHGGGCAEHSYQLAIGSAWMESFPVQVRARVAHNANGDPCRALLRRELLMSLRPLQDAYREAYKQQHGSVSIQLVGATAPLLFVF